jgi:acetoin utilization protein AcuC
MSGISTEIDINRDSSNLHVSYSPDYLQWQLGSGNGSHPTNPIRAELAMEFLVAELGDAVSVIDPATADMTSVRRAIESIHDPDYVSSVIDDGVSDEWTRNKTWMGNTAAVMFAGTQLLVEGMLNNAFSVGFNPQGAKHHAHFDHSSGFCVFNDMAWAAIEFQNAGLKPLYLDWDIHAGDGVQHLLEGTIIPTLSVHNHSIYPGDPETINRELARAGKNHSAHDEERHIYNWGINNGAGDEVLLGLLNGEIEEVVKRYKPDVILLAAGADGHGGTSNLGSTNNYTYEGFTHAATKVAEWANSYSQGRVLIGGAGGYQPLDHTPRIWANVVETIYTETAQKRSAQEAK